MGHVSLATGEKALALGANSDASGAKSMAIGSTLLRMVKILFLSEITHNLKNLV